MDQPDLTFGRANLAPRLRRLQIDGKPVKLGGRAFDILLALAENIGVTIDKNALIKRAWPDLVVEEGALRVHIVAIRKALAPDPDISIEAVPGEGYRLICRSLTLASLRPTGAAGLPLGLPTIFGRQEFTNAIVDALGRSTLTTIVGPGGIGKTTVAIAACQRVMTSYRNAVCFVDFGAVADPSIVADTLARRLGLAVFSRDPTLGILRHLQDKQILLVFDTCEHVVEAVADLAERALTGASGLRILATSREPLRVPGECVLRLPPLDLPPGATVATLEQARIYSALAMFVDRTSSSGGLLSDDDCTLLSEVCGRLDGVPLAIEIAAAHVGMLGLPIVASQIGTRFALAAKGRRTSLSRHQTLQSTLDWSYGLLTLDEKTALRGLSVFVAGFTLTGATAVIGPDISKSTTVSDVVGELVSKSLVVAIEGKVRHYRLLDTTRRYAYEVLKASGSEHTIAERHARFCVNFLVEAEHDATVVSDTDWLNNFGSVLEDARAALAWCYSSEGNKALGVELTVASIQLWTRNALFEEHRRIIEQAIDNLRDLRLLGTEIELKLRLAMGNILYHSGGIPLDSATDAEFLRAFTLAQAIGTSADRIRALTAICAQGISRGDYAGNHKYEPDFMMSGKGPLAPIASRVLAHNLMYMGRLQEARHALEPAMEYETATPTPAGSGVQYAHKTLVDTVRARLTWLEGQPDDAIKIATEAVEVAATGGPISLCLTLATGALFVASMNGDEMLTERFLSMLDNHATRHSMRRWREYAAGYRLALIPRSDRTAAEAKQFADHVAESNGGLLESLAVLGNDRTTPELIQKALDGQAGWCRAELIRAKTEHLLGSGAITRLEAKSSFDEAFALAEAQGALAWTLRIGTSMALLLEGEQHFTKAVGLLQRILDHFQGQSQTADISAARNLLKRLKTN